MKGASSARGERTMDHEPKKPSSAANAMMLPKLVANGQNTSWRTPPTKKLMNMLLSGPIRSQTKPANIWRVRDECRKRGDVSIPRRGEATLRQEKTHATESTRKVADDEWYGW